MPCPPSSALCASTWRLFRQCFSGIELLLQWFSWVTALWRTGGREQSDEREAGRGSEEGGQYNAPRLCFLLTEFSGSTVCLESIQGMISIRKWGDSSGIPWFSSSKWRRSVPWCQSVKRKPLRCCRAASRSEPSEGARGGMEEHVRGLAGLSYAAQMACVA